MWPTTPVRFVLTEVDERGPREGEEGELLSVSEYRGVIPRSASASQQAASEDTSHYKRCEPGQLVLNRLWAFRGGLGVSDLTGLVSPDYAVFDIDPRMDPRFVHYQTRSSWFVAEMTKRLRGIGSPDASNGRAPRINSNDLGRIEMHTPALNVQRKIVAMLDAEVERINTLISKQRQFISLLRKRLAGLVDELFGGADSHIPLGYLAMISISGVDKHSVPGQRSIRLCNYTDVYYSRAIKDSTDFMSATCSESEFQRLHLLPGDVLMTKDSETAEDIAIPAIVKTDDSDLVLGYHNALLRPVDQRLHSDYLFWLLESRQARNHFARKARGVTRVGLRSEDVAALPVPLLSPDAQRRVADELWSTSERIESLAARVATQISLAETRQRSLIVAAVTGQLAG